MTRGRMTRIISVLAMTALWYLLSTGDAYAQVPPIPGSLLALILAFLGGGGGAACGVESIGGVLCNTVASTEYVPGLLSGFAYLTGLILGAMAIAKLYEHVQNPMQVSIWESIKRFIAGGAMFALPMVIEVVYNTVAFEIDGADDSSGFNTVGATGFGLDAMVVALMADVWNPMLDVLSAFGYLAGIILVIIGIMRMVKSSQDGPRGPGGFGTIMTFVVAGALFSLNSMMGAWQGSMFLTDQLSTFGVLQFTTGMDPIEIGHVESVIAGVLAFMMILGWISFIRGWFILRDVAEGDQQASLMAGITHLFGGALCVNLGAVINAVQNTLGLQDYGIMFS